MLPTRLRTALEELIAEYHEHAHLTVKKSDTYIGVFWDKCKHVDCEFLEEPNRHASTHYAILTARVYGTENNDIIRSMRPGQGGKRHFDLEITLAITSVECNYASDFTHIEFKLYGPEHWGPDLLQCLGDIVADSTK